MAKENKRATKAARGGEQATKEKAEKEKATQEKATREQKPLQSGEAAEAAAVEATDVERTLSDIKQEKQNERDAQKAKRKPWLIVLMIVFFPVTGVVWLVRKMFRTINMPLTAKMTVIYAAIFFLVLSAFVIFFIESVRKAAGGVGGYVRMLIITSCVLVVVVSALYAAMVWLSSQFMLKPIRDITDGIDKVTGENLSARLKQVDSQDELMDLTNRINDMLDNLEQSFIRQQNFVADASHELKTPISVIRGYSNMLMRWGKDDPAVLGEGIEAIARESENMQRIIEQLLLLARLGNFSLNATRFNLVEVTAEIAESYKMVDFTHTIVYRCHEDAITLETDKNLVTECVRALIDNAIKYTPEGGRITVSCEMREGRAVICVEDTGVGIKAEDLPHIFERFYRCDKARGREKGSTGLGLSIAKSIVNTVGGEISVESTVGVGTKFTVTI